MAEPTIRIAARLQLRNGHLTELLERRGWNQADLARELGVHATLVSQWMLLRGYPPKNPALLRRLMELTGVADDEIFPPQVYGRPKHARPRTTITTIRDVPVEALPRLKPPVPQLPSAEATYAQVERQQVIRDAMAQVLSPKERGILTERWGLDGHTPQRLEDLAETYGVSRERISKIEAQAFRRLRDHPRARRLLEPLVTGEPLARDWSQVVHPAEVVPPPPPPSAPPTPRPVPVPPPARALRLEPWQMPYRARPVSPEHPLAEGIEVLRVPASWEQVTHANDPTGRLCITPRPATEGAQPCACGHIRLIW